MTDPELPPVSLRRLHWFDLYVSRYLSKHFHALHLLRLADLAALDGYPILVCVNHPSWWDPLIGFHLSQRFFAKRSHYAPIASVGLAKYRFFERLGFFGIETNSRAGASRFLRLGSSVLREPKAALWVTPQGKFVDARNRPVMIEPGVGHLARRASRFAMLPIALEYGFWSERSIEAFACLGAPVFVESGKQHSAGEWNQIFSSALEKTQDCLAERVKHRDSHAFEALLAGKAGIGGIYDLCRSLKAHWKGELFRPEHESR